MRNLQDLFILLALSILTASTISADASAQLPNVPYDAFVLKGKTKVYSGPGGAFYPTHELEKGELVQVHRHDPGGWCAIRPPEKSFSLVPESAIEMLTEDIGEVLADDTQTWVGTLLGPVDKPLPQVKIDKGDRVVVVGEIGWPHPSGTTNVWYQIQPPAGEFRWVKLSDLQLPPADEPEIRKPTNKPERIKPFSRPQKNTAQNAKPDQQNFANTSRTAPEQTNNKPTYNKADAGPSSRNQETAQVSFEQPIESQGETATASRSGWRTATKPIPKSDPAKSDFQTSDYRSSAFNQSRKQDSQDSFASSDSFDRDIDNRQNDSIDRRHSFANSRLQNQASASQQPSNWNNNSFDSLRSSGSRTGQFRDDRYASLESMDTQVRSYNAANYASPNANSLLDLENRLSKEMVKDPQQWQLNSLKRDAQQAFQNSSDAVERMALQRVLDKLQECETLQRGFLASSSNAVASFGQNSSATPSQNYDATGWLKQLASSAGSVDPVYVLLDDNGKTTHHVAGSVGMNLGNYVDTKIGVFGRRGFHRRLNLAHVTADRVVVLPR